MEKNSSEEIKTLLIITCIIILVVIGLYFLTEKVLNKKEPDEKIESVITYNEILMGTLLELSDEEYFVLVYEQDEPGAYFYESLYLRYLDKEDAIPIYESNLSIKFHESFIGDETNVKAKSISDIKIKNGALFKIKNNKITNIYDTEETIEKALS